MTNLELETAEELQVANYGIGGHYGYNLLKINLIKRFLFLKIPILTFQE